MIPGDVLGRQYELVARLGKGGMGEVWRARHLETGEHVAVKVLLEELAQDSALQKRFLREARAAAAVKHPNVVALRQVQEGEDGAPFLVMELLEGETLGRRLKRRGALTVVETASILLPVFDAVEAAHAAGLVHRDLKPENIFLAREPDNSERVRVLDFGIAKRIDKLAAPTSSASADTTAAPVTTGAMLGTPYYMAPEQALGEKDIDGRADVWSLGVILYECLSGRRPTEAATLGAILKIIVTDGVVPLSEVVPGVDGSLAAAVMHMLRTSRVERAPSLEEIRKELLERLERLETSREGPRPRTVPKPSWLRPLIGTLALGTVAVAIAARWFGAGAGHAAPIGAPEASSAPALSAPVAVLAEAAATATSATSATKAPAAPTAMPTTVSSAKLSATPPTSAPSVATAAPAAAAPATQAAARSPGRGPSGLVIDNPFGPSSSSPPK